MEGRTVHIRRKDCGRRNFLHWLFEYLLACSDMKIKEGSEQRLKACSFALKSGSPGKFWNQ